MGSGAQPRARDKKRTDPKKKRKNQNTRTSATRSALCAAGTPGQGARLSKKNGFAGRSLTFRWLLCAVPDPRTTDTRDEGGAQLHAKQQKIKLSA